MVAIATLCIAQAEATRVASKPHDLVRDVAALASLMLSAQGWSRDCIFPKASSSLRRGRDEDGNRNRNNGFNSPCPQDALSMTSPRGVIFTKK